MKKQQENQTSLRKIPTLLLLEPEQYKQLKLVAFKTEQSMSEVTRQALQASFDLLSQRELQDENR